MEASQDLATALRRVEDTLRRRPEFGLHEDAPATARWQGGTRVVAQHANGHQAATEMPAELGGSDAAVTPGWLFRAGVASCAATSIVMVAATQDVTLSALEVRVGSRSDSRGMLGVPDSEGRAVYAGPGEMQLQVRVAATGVPAARLRALVETALVRSPIPGAVRQATPLAVQIDIDEA